MSPGDVFFLLAIVAISMVVPCCVVWYDRDSYKLKSRLGLLRDILICWLVPVGVVIVSVFVFGDVGAGLLDFLSFIWGLISVFIIYLAISQRVRDAGLPRKLAYIATVPFISLLILLYLLFAPPKREQGGDIVG